MVGLGVSSISDSWTSFAQNEKKIETYYELLNKNQIPVIKGHILTDEDLLIRKHILNLICTGITKIDFSSNVLDTKNILENLKEFEKDELIYIDEDTIHIRTKGHPFLRNICMAFDLRFQREKPDRQLFSMTI